MITYHTAILCISMICSSAVVVFASNKGPINYLKVLVNNKKSNKPAQVLVGGHPVIGLPARLTFRDVHSQTNHLSNDRHMTAGGDRKAVNGDTKAVNSDTRAVTGDKKVAKRREHEALVQQMCSEIISAVHKKIVEQSTGAVASGTTTYRTQFQRRKQSSRKVWTRPVGITSYFERLQKESAGDTNGPEVRYHDPIYAQEADRVDYLTSYPLSKNDGVGAAEEDDDEEDVDQSPKEWKLNMVGEHVIYKSANSRKHHSDASVTDTSGGLAREAREKSPPGPSIMSY